MEIGLIYSDNDPNQKKIRDFLVKFISDHGVCARIVEKNRPVSEPTITIDGLKLPVSAAPDKKAVKKHSLPSLDQIASALEHRIWCL